MSHRKRQKLDRTSTAAYAANQPLLSALKHATESVAKQSSCLTKARDISQSLHVNIVNGDHEQHEEYMNSIVHAYKLAIDNYCAIFEQMVSITAAEPTEGRDAGKRHEEFTALLATAKNTQGVAGNYGSVTHENSEEDEDVDESPTDVTIQKERASDDEHANEEPASAVNISGKRPLIRVESTPKAKSDTSILNAKFYRNKSGEVIWENGELKVPVKSLTSDESKAWGIIRRRKKHVTRRSKSAAGRRRENEEIEAAAKSYDHVITEPAAKTDEQKPEIEYEDISAQVEERIRAKEEKKNADKAARKAEKKRKRESGESFVAAGAEKVAPEPREAIKSLVQKDIAQMPARKKSKKADKDKERVVEDDTAKDVKREESKKVAKRKDADAEEQHVGKKRNKLKGS